MFTAAKNTKQKTHNHSSSAKQAYGGDPSGSPVNPLPSLYMETRTPLHGLQNGTSASLLKLRLSPSQTRDGKGSICVGAAS